MTRLNLIKAYFTEIIAPKKFKLGLLLLSFITIFMGGTAAAQTTFVVTNTDDSGTNSIRWAIEQANAETGESTIQFDIPFTDPGYQSLTGSWRIEPASELPEITEPLIISGLVDGLPAIELNGSSQPSGPGLLVSASNSEIEGLIIAGFSESGLEIIGSENSVVSNNYLGIGPNGVTTDGNGSYGLRIISGSGTQVLNNLISGNGDHGIWVSGSFTSGVIIRENKVGTDLSGTLKKPNSGNGIYVQQSFNVTIQDNLVSGNEFAGIEINDATQSNFIIGNLIGTTESGIAALGNEEEGIVINNASEVIVGGLDPADRNIIAANGDHGISIEKVQELESKGVNNSVIGNYIGVGSDGITPLGNTFAGVFIRAVDTSVGGTEDGAANIIAFNNIGVMLRTGFISPTINNSILSNSIFSNNLLGIDIDITTDGGFGGVPLENDSGDSDSGTNNLQNFPDLMSSTFDELDGSVEITYSLSSDPANSSYPVEIEFFKTTPDERQGKDLLGRDTYTEANFTSGEKTISLTIPAGISFETGDQIVATATDNQGNTSEFSEAIFEEVELGPEDFVVVNNNDTGEGSFRQVIENVNSSSEAQTITFDIQGAGPHVIQPQSQYISFTNSVIIDGTTQSGYSEGTPVIVLDGSLVEDISGLVFTGTAENSTVRGLSIINFDTYGIRLVSDNNTIEGTFIGIDPDGNVAGNGEGISTLNSVGNQIGGTDTAQRNIITGNRVGIDIGPGSESNVVEGNYIGLNPAGTSAPGNKFNLQIRGSNSNRVGGNTPEQRNVVSGAYFETVDGQNTGGSGIVLTSGTTSGGTTLSPSGNTILGNYIGTDATGTLSLSNERGGVLLLFGATENLVGGELAGEGNLISGNGQYGIFLQGNDERPVTFNEIKGNRIGVDATGNAALGNTAGVFLWGENRNNQIGGTSEEAANIISGNSNTGIVLFRGGGENTIIGNRVGVTENGDPLGNGFNGIGIAGSSDNRVGGENSGEPNIISHNARSGIEITDEDGFDSVNNSILSNEIFDNGVLGIDLAGDGITQNDDLDADTGPNNLQNYPEISSYSVSNDQLSITYSLSTDPANSSYPVRVEFFRADADFAQARTYLGSDSYTSTDYSSGNKFITITLPTVDAFTEGDLIVATATDAAGNSSELSAAVTGSSIFIVTNTNDSGAGSLREAMTLSEFSPQPATIQFNIPGDAPYTIAPESPLPTLLAPVTINGATQPGFLDGSNTPPPIIEISGTNAGSANGLNIHGGNSHVEALIINQFSGAGISIREKGSNTILNCFIGTNAEGNTAASNGSAGISVDNVSNNTIFGNLISGNNTGIFMQQSGAIGNVLEDNTIGLDVTGTVAIPNSGDGIRLANGPNGNGIVDNFISGNDGNGVYIFDLLDMGTSDNTVRGNVIGTDQSVTTRVPNQGDGIRIEQSGNSEISFNILSGNRSNGIEINGAESRDNHIFGNIIGLAEDGLTKLANQGSGVAIIDAVDNIIGGDETSLRNLISGNGGIFDGFLFRANGVLLSGDATGNRIQGNFIGTDLNGDPQTDTGNFSDGIKVEQGSSNNIIGLDETETGMGNVIAGNGEIEESGVTIVDDNSLSNRISGNSIFGNLTTGIDLGGDGITDNDADDSVTGPNNLQNHPVLSSVIYDDTQSEITATFSVPSDPANSVYPLRIEFYKNSGNRQGEVYLGSAQYEMSDFGSNKVVVVTLSDSDLIAEGDEITALSISATGNTSEFGGTVLVESTATTPGTPVLATPTDNATDVSASPLFAWETAAGADTYELQVSTASDFSSTILNETGITNTEFQTTQLSYSTGYFWRVRASNSAGQSDWSTIWSFTTEPEPVNAPNVVTLSSPSDNASDVSVSPLFTWQASEAAETYELQVSTSSDFSSTIVSETGITNTELQAPELSYETGYFWRVRASNSAGQSDWSITRGFTTEEEPLNPPGIVMLLLPSDGTTDISTGVTFSWQQESVADSYQIQVSEDQQFVTSQIDEQGISEISYDVNGLSPSTTYYWRVRAQNEDGTGEWSSIWSFSTASLTPPVSLVLTVENSNPKVSWDAGSVGSTSDVNVYRGVRASALELIEAVTGGESEFLDSSAPSGPLFYAVTTFTSDGQESDFSDVVNYYSEVFTASEEWQLVSHPVSSVSLNVSGALTYGFNRVYQSNTNLQSGSGYWIKSDTPLDLSVAGQGALTLDLELNEGWNLIGTPSGTVQITDLEDTDSILPGSPVYRFNNGSYEAVSEIEAGLGYWIFADQPGTITANVDLTPQKAGKSTDFIASRVENVPVNRLIVSQSGNREEIIIMASPLTQKQEYQYMKPPQAPEPKLDFRTVNHLFAADESITELKLISNFWPVTLNFRSDEDTNKAIRIHLKDETGANFTRDLLDGGELSLMKPYSYMAVELITSDEMVTETILEPGYPNPFNPSTNIRYRIAQQADVTVEVYDTGGRRVAILVNQQQQPGTYTVPFNASNLASGIYFVRMNAGAFTNIQKLTLIK